MECPGCKTRIPQSALFCHHCGMKIEVISKEDKEIVNEKVKGDLISGLKWVILINWVIFICSFLIINSVIGTSFWPGLFFAIISALLVIDLGNRYNFGHILVSGSFRKFFNFKISPLKRIGVRFYYISFSVILLLVVYHKVITAGMYNHYKFNNKIIELAEEKNFEALNDTLKNLNAINRQDDIIYTIDWFLSCKPPLDKRTVIEQFIINNPNSTILDSILLLYNKNGINDFLNKDEIVSCLMITQSDKLIDSIIARFGRFNLSELKPVIAKKLNELPDKPALQSKWIFFLNSVDREYFIQAFLAEYKKYISDIIGGEGQFSSSNKLVTAFSYFNFNSQPTINSISYCFDKVKSNTEKINSLSSSRPEKPTYSAPEKPYLPVFVRWNRLMNYNGVGVLAIDDEFQYFIITNAFKKMDFYFEGYILYREGIQTITLSSGGAFDALMVEEVYEQDYHQMKNEYQQKVRDAKNNYAESMKEYNKKFAIVESENAQKFELKRSNTELLNVIKELINKL